MTSDADRRAARPNILFIFPDQWRFDCLSALGHPVVETPNLDQLAHEGTLFTSAYTPAPTCIPARAALATGMSPSTCGRLGYRDGVPWPYDTFMQRLRDGGYHTMCAGKTHFWPARARLGFEELQLYEMLYQDMEHPSDYHVWLRRQVGDLVRDGGEELDSNACLAAPWTHDENLHPSSWTVTAAIELLERRDPTRPFFMQLGFHRPHPPYDPPLAWFERFGDCELPPVPVGDWAEEFAVPVKRIDPDRGVLPPRVLDRSRRAYYAQMAYIDFQIGRMVRYLKGRRLLDSTWVVFCSDHGEQLGDHHLYRKTTPFEGSAHVPLIVKPPQGSGLPTGTRISAVTTLQDLAATFLDLGQADAPEGLEGRSLVPHLRTEAPSWREFIHGEHTPGWQFVTDGKEKLVWRSTDDRRWFFDLEEDPSELRNLIGDPAYAERVTLWEQRLVGVLAQRPQDGLTDGTSLAGGHSVPAVRPWLQELGE
ncbi:MAG: arylsulfatase [Lentisphaerae bacterium]|jgi:arylsulfatase|nr:arylsulfatase [Lentisphaerota bacterium]MBT4819706.1 arylsulfatase [Lentisphaerota bacterium]MBT5612114.1 arylsulfatase [Lentisphaerota bacterium]MBT7056885.1 arylsulfatase [Lentisphaerota bacterium]